MGHFDDIANTIVYIILDMLQENDLLRALRVCRRIRDIGIPLLDRRLCFPVSPGCHKCHHVEGKQETTEKQRLRAIQVLIDDRRASHLVDLTITDSDRSCRCQVQSWLNVDSVRHFNDLSFTILASLLPNAAHLRRLCVEICDPVTCSRLIECLTRIISPGASLESANRHLLQLRHLSITLLLGSNMQTLPTLEKLRSLHMHFLSRRRATTILSGSKLVDFGRYPQLEQLYLEGDTWSGGVDAFMGNTHSLTVCVLKGPLVLAARCNEFFNMMSTSLRYLYCYGTHLVARIRTEFPSLQHVSLHRVITNSGIFPFTGCTALSSLAVEADDVHTSGWLDDINSLVQDAILHTARSLRSLSIRSSFLCILSPMVAHELLRANCLSILLLDGAIVMDGRDWLLLSRLSRIEIVARINSWALIQDAAQTLVSQPIPGMFSDRGGIYSVLSAESLSSVKGCNCGLLNRQFMLQRMGLESIGVEIYSWLIADPRCKSCDHLNCLIDEESEFMSPDEALVRMTGLPGSNPHICTINPRGAMMA